MNLPIYRAKKIDSDEHFEGLYSDTYFMCMGDMNGHFIHYKKQSLKGNEYTATIEIDSTTLAIHFPDMIDSQGNKIFASLQKDGKGGDILYYEDDCQPYICEHSSDGTFLFEYLDDKTIKNYICRLSGNKVLFEDLKVIGIQE